MVFCSSNTSHSNVDRQFAIWQALNVDNTSNWFDQPDEQLPDDGTWSIKKDTIDTPKTPLAPFHSDTKGTYHTSDSIRNWMRLYYSYPELQPWLPKYYVDGKFNKEAYIADINQQLNKLYSSTRTLLIDQPSLRVDGKHLDYIVNVRYKK
jgi:tyrosinase